MIDVAILGAGVSGLATAYFLRDQGLSVQVFEARDRLGGRAFTLDGVDLGATWVWDHERTVHAVLTELGIATRACDNPGLDTYDDGTLQRGRFPTSGASERRLVGGMRTLVDALANHAAPARLNCPVRGLEPVADGVVVHTAAPVRARHVVAALPPALVAPWVPEAPWLAQVPVWMGAVAKCVGVFDRPVWTEQGWSGRAFSRVGPMSEVHDLSSDGVHALFGFAHRSDADDLNDRVRAQFLRLFGAAPTRVICQRWWREPFTTPPHGPEDQRLFAHPRLREPLLDGRLHLVSCETSGTSPGHIDGALERAQAVAKHLLETR